MQIIQAQAVYENDEFEYELGLDSKLVHRPVLRDRGEIILFYGLFKLTNGGYGFEVMSPEETWIPMPRNIPKRLIPHTAHGKSNYIGMAKKTVIKQALKYAPLKSDFRRALSTDETIKMELAPDMGEVQGEAVWDAEYEEAS